MIKARYIFSMFAGVLGLVALATPAEARVYVQCDSSTWPNDQNCQFGNNTNARVTTTSNAAKTAHSITISFVRAQTTFTATSLALDGNSRVIPDSTVSTKSSATLAFSTLASNPARRLKTTLDAVAVITRGARASTIDTWPSNTNNRIFNDAGGTLVRCDVGGRSDATLTSHTLSTNLISGQNGGCAGFPLTSSGGVLFGVDDFAPGQTPVSTPFTTTVAGRPRRVQGGSSAPSS